MNLLFLCPVKHPAAAPGLRPASPPAGWLSRAAGACARWVLGAGLLLAGAPAFAQSPVPVALTGFTADVVANGTGTAGATTTAAFDGSGYVLMEKGYAGGNTTATVGLPTGGRFTSATGSGAVYQLASYSANNSAQGGATLTFAAPQAASTVYVLAATGSGNSTNSVFTATFTDGSTQTLGTTTVPDWFGGAGAAIAGLGRVDRGASGVSNNTTDPRLYEYSFAVSTANTNKAIQSITVSQTGGVLNVMAVSVVPVQATITSLSPSPAGTGIPATLTGTGLGGASLVINGAPATILTNTGTTITFRVPAGATATGTSSVTTPSNTATTTAFTYLPPPGNALAFDGVDDFVSFGATPAVTNLGPGNFTLEAWVYYDGGTGAESIIRKTGDYNLYINGNTLHAEVWPSGTGNASWLRADGTTALPANRWTHVAAVWNKTAATYQLYVNGVADGTGATTAGTVSGSENLTLGKSTIYGNLLTGRLDEVRIYTAALTAANLQADMTSPTASVPASLGLYLNFDEGTAGGANAAVTTLFDTKNSSNGTLTNFALASGNTTSNWVESYAMVVPRATAATNATATSFVANWLAPILGSVDNGYRVELSTSPTFVPLMPDAPVGLTGTSYTFTNLTPGTTYYYRVRADKQSVTNQGANSNIITVGVPSNVATLSNLTLSAGALSPAFASGTTSYTLTVPGTTTSTTATPTVTQPNATVTVNGVAVASGTASGGIALSPGTNTLTVVVTAQDGTTKQTYTVTVTRTCALTVVARNVAAPLGSTGTATVTAAQVDNGSSSTCAPVTLGVQRVLSARVGENGSITLTAPAGTVFTAVTFASYGTPTANADGTYSINTNCHASTSQSVAEGALLGKNTGTIQANNNTFGDPCVGTVKTLVVQATYTPASQVSYTCADLGNNLVALTVTDAGNNTKTVVAVVTVSTPALTTTTWNGSTSTDWTDCRNWSYGQVPGAGISAVIPAGLSTYPSIPAGTFAVNDLTLASGASLATATGTTLQVNGNFSNSGTTTSLAGTVAFVGAAATPALGGSTATTFNAIAVSKSSGTVQLGQNATVTASLTMSGGLLDTKTYQVTLPSGATISETDASYVLGSVAATRTLAAGTTESFGGLGLSLTPAAGSTAPGSTPVVRTTGTALAGVGTSQGILRYFTITPATKIGLNVALVFSYFAHELATSPATPEASLALFKSETGTSNSWLNQNPATLNASAKTVTKTGITSFSVWTLANGASPLPVELVSFTAVAQGPTAVRLAWATANEVNSARFEVERSLDGVSYAKIGAVAAAGTTATAHTYALTDAAPAGLLYYRLRQVDLDGTVHYAPVRTVTLTGAATTLALYPNPTPGAATLTGATAGTLVQVLDALGRVVAAATADASGTAVLPGGLPTGVYVVRNGAQALRLTVE